MRRRSVPSTEEAGMRRTPRFTWQRGAAVALLTALAVLTSLSGAPSRSGLAPERAQAAASPIEHVVVVVMENRTFDNLLGKLCANQGGRCDGATTGKMPGGTVVPLVAEPDLRPDINHSHESQVKAINGGLMDGFRNVAGCNNTNSPCLSQVMGTANSQVPNVWALADTYAISDATFEPYTASSWVAHLELAAGTRQLWRGNNPKNSQLHAPGPGWGCNSFKDGQWDLSPSTFELRPSCVPDASGAGPYRASAVPHTPTIMDRLQAAGRSWKIYVNSVNSAWSICATFYSCYGSSQKTNVVKQTQLTTDAQNGTLPNFSFVIPKNFNSMHPSFSLIDGDNWLKSVVDPLLRGPQRLSTAIFVVWDDCGCIYDHVNPLQFASKWGPRVPVLIVSPYAKPRFVDHTPTTFASILAYAQHNFGLAPLSDQDTGAYDYANAFDYAQTPIAPQALATRMTPLESRLWLARHPHTVDDDAENPLGEGGMGIWSGSGAGE
jgi:phospholipase C